MDNENSNNNNSITTTAANSNDTEEYSLASDLFMELASELRCSILVFVSKKPSKLSLLAREFKTTVQDVHRNTNRLMEAGLVKKKEDGAIYLTEYGRIIVKQVPYFIFMKKHARYFEEHSLDGIPEKFVQRIGSLQNAKLVYSVAAVMEKIKRIESSTQKKLKIMLSQAWAEEGKIIIELLMHGIQVQTIRGGNTVHPKEIESIVKMIERHPTNDKKLEPRMVDKVNVALYISDDKDAAVIFPNKNGEIDMNAIFIGNDAEFYEWCKDLFDYYWSRAGYFDSKKTRWV